MTSYSRAVDGLIKEYGSDRLLGLTRERAKSRLLKYGPNEPFEETEKSLFIRFIYKLKDPVVIILIAAAIASVILAVINGGGGFADPVIIIAIVAIYAALGLTQESRAGKALDAPKKISAPLAKVIRDGVLLEVAAAELVTGDVIALEAGDVVPADARLLESADLQCEESSLRGKTAAARKDFAVKVPENAPLEGRVNMVYSGCAVTCGRGKAIVTATGMNTETGKIAKLSAPAGPETTPLQNSLKSLGKTLRLASLIICAVIFSTGIFKGLPVIEIFMTAVSLSVPVIPGGMASAVAAVLALGVGRMMKRGALIRKLAAVEAMGGASVICADKTGTLTQNRLAVKKLWAVGGKIVDIENEPGKRERHLLRLGTLCSDGGIEEDEDGTPGHTGDPTGAAIIAAGMNIGLNREKLEKSFPQVAELPFDSDRKLMSTVHDMGGKLLVITKGGLDVLLPRCLDPEKSAAQANRLMGEGGLRVIAVACREISSLPTVINSANLEKKLVLMGVIGMLDPPREESKRAVAHCREAGIRTVMITGDHPSAAKAIARELGIFKDGDKAISGAQLIALDDEEFLRSVREYSVYARVGPEDKIRIVKAWQDEGEVVAMTGSGANDAPALKAAEIGCAMGITGTDAAKMAADIIITDDSFWAIAEAARQGRGVADNIRKTVRFLLSCNLGEVCAVFIALLLGWGLPVQAIHLLLIIVVTSAFPALALGLEPVDRHIMKRKPVSQSRGLFAEGFAASVIIQGTAIGLLALMGYYIGLKRNLSSFVPPSEEVGATMAFLVLSLSQLTQAVNCRSSRSVFRMGVTTNKAILCAILFSGGLTAVICAAPFFRSVFRLSNLSMYHWLAAVILSVLPLISGEITKLLFWIRERSEREKA